MISQMPTGSPASPELIKLVADLHAEIRRLRAELIVRTSPPPVDFPKRYARQRTAFKCGFEDGWRNRPLKIPYSSYLHRRAFADGYKAGEAESLKHIGKML